MYIVFDQDNLKKREETRFLCEGEVIYSSIYDFAYKYRTRIFNEKNEEVAYVQKDIYSDDRVIFYDSKNRRLDELIRTDEGYQSDKYLYVGDINKGEAEGLFINENGKLSIDDEKSILYAIMFMTGMIEINRKD
ncbi:MAG: hypothetical protein IJH00_02645 [Erysipelotrichaceae bacterium]|nr:hypothetical protein [Erysipelotrichaceae bacterium]